MRKGTAEPSRAEQTAAGQTVGLLRPHRRLPVAAETLAASGTTVAQGRQSPETPAGPEMPALAQILAEATGPEIPGMPGPLAAMQTLLGHMLLDPAAAPLQMTGRTAEAGGTG